jgi:hypothetical protein
MDLFLRKVIHPQAVDNYRVILDDTKIEVGSIGIQAQTGTAEHWVWGIDTAIPMREVQADGTGKDRTDCTRQFRAAWERFSSDPGRLSEFLEIKRSRLR